MHSCFYAHSRQNTDGTPQPPEQWELLYTGTGVGHLERVAKLTSQFAASFGAADWGRLAGLWHDLGKYSDQFQSYLRQQNGFEAHLEQASRVDHSTAGAQLAFQLVPKCGRLLAYVIAGHHAGLADGDRLTARLQKQIEPWEQNVDRALTAVSAVGLPPLTISHKSMERYAHQLALFTRMLFSALIDADRLETERFCDPERYGQRRPSPDLTALAVVLDKYLQRLVEHAEPTEVNHRRRGILAACRAAARERPGLYSLSVPTGGGKTLASLAFALDHAGHHGHRRVIVTIPFTSIIEQTADVYRGVFEPLGDGVVVEHHSNIDPEIETRRNRLASENWDAPLVVTTNVQFFESLFASRTTPCRKLHRLARSIIILDEAQTLPIGLLRPCLDTLRELVEDYGCTIVLCTATQPALERRDDFRIGLEGTREIISDPNDLYTRMRRVEVGHLGRIGDDSLLGRLAAEPSWLTIVNTRSHAAALYRKVIEAAGSGESARRHGYYHLSALMCGEHRSRRIRQIRRRLSGGKPCRVVSTQLIEAGVDVDFPVVFRAVAGIDSIAQAAGRCNREGRIPRGKLWLFDSHDEMLRGFLGAAAATTREVLPDFPDPLDPAAVRRYFELHYWQAEGDHGWDNNGVMECFPEERGDFAYDFRTASERFRVIDDATHTVFVPYRNGRRLIARLKKEGPSRNLLRALQRFAVGLYERDYQALRAAGDIEQSEDGYDVLENRDLYDNELGLRTDEPGYRSPDNLIQ